MSTLLKKPKPKSNSHDINIYFAKVNNINKSDESNKKSSDNEYDNVIINKYEPSKYEPGKHEPSKLPDKLMSYIEQLNPIEKIVLKIAQEHLETSFNLEKSIGYEQWIKSQQTPPPP